MTRRRSISADRFATSAPSIVSDTIVRRRGYWTNPVRKDIIRFNTEPGTFKGSRFVKEFTVSMLNVLYADDERGMLELGKEFLEMSGRLRVETATSAREALRKMADHRFDAIVSDYQMPEMDGLEFLRRVRSRDKFIPFILFTGHGREEVVIEACNAGASGYLQKGGSPTPMFVELEHRIEQAVDKHIAEKDLLTANVQAKLAMGLAKIASWEFDSEEKVFRFDENFNRLYGATAHCKGVSVINPETYLLDLIHPDDRQMVLDWIKKDRGRGRPEGHAQIEHRIVRNDGVVRWVVVRVGSVLGLDGRLIKVCGVIQDITDLKMAATGGGEKLGAYRSDVFPEKTYCLY
jgi:PAS domain S-box-containing protein